MKKKAINIFILIILLVILVYITYKVTSNYYSNIYQVYIGQHAINNEYKFKTTSLNVNTKQLQTSMFHLAVPITVSFSGEITQVCEGYRPYIKRIHISEKLVEEREAQPYVLIEITPVLDRDNREKTYYLKEPVGYSFKYKLRTFLSFETNKYVIRCGDKEKVIEIENVK